MKIRLNLEFEILRDVEVRIIEKEVKPLGGGVNGKAVKCAECGNTIPAWSGYPLKKGGYAHLECVKEKGLLCT